MKNKQYVIVSVSQEYNDEITCLGDEGGTPTNVFDNKEKANEACLRLNAEYFDGIMVNDYCFDIEDALDSHMDQMTAIFKLKDISTKFSKLDVEDKECLRNLQIPNDLKLDQLKEIAKIFSGLKFYKIYEVDSQ